MFKIDDNYSDYHTTDPVKYPGGAAINSSGVDTTDGTPWLAKMFNNCGGWMQALYIKAFGNLNGISNDAENAQTSDVVRALEKIQTDNNAAERATSEAAYFKKSGGTINGNVDVNGQFTAKGSTIDGALHVKGDLLVDGTGKEIISTELNVGADTIKLRKDNPTGLTPSELAGVITENYDGNGNNNILAVDKDGNACVGDIDIATRLLYSNDGTNFFEDEALTITATIGQDEIVRDTGNTTSGGVKIYEGTTFSNDDTEAIATREDNPVNGGFAKWNAAAKRFDAAVPDAMPTAGSQNLATSGGIFAMLQASLPVGAVFPFAGASAPQGFLLCDGSAYGRANPLYANLFAVIGITYGGGDGVTTFNVPDLRGRAVMGADASNPLGTSQSDQNKSHRHSISHTHTRGTMDITGQDAMAWAGQHNGAINNAGRRSGALSANIQYTNEPPNKWGNTVAEGSGGSTVPVGIAFQASLGWTGDTSEPSNGTSGDEGGTEARPKNVRMNWIIKY